MNIQSVFQSFDVWSKNTMAWFSSSTSAMDLHTAVICAGVFVISALVVYLISVFGMRERTYEEAIEEQRRRNQEAIQQAKSDKNKKEKKFKKWGKKSKEKIEEEKSANGDTEKVSEDTETKPELESNNVSIQDLKILGSKRKGRQRKAIVQEKGEEGMQQSSSEETDDPVSAGSSTGNTTQTNEEDKKSILLEKIIRAKEDFKNQNSESSIDIPDEKIEEIDSVKHVKKSPVKKNKKIKVDTSDLLSQDSEAHEWNETKLLNIIKLTSFSDDEIQHLIDALNYKVKGGIDKKKSEIITLKKLIQEKEEALRSEQNMCQAATDQINDLLQELNDKKTQAASTEKSLRDALNQEQQEIKALHGMMQRKREQYASELATVQSKMQQMKNKMKEEHSLALQRLQEENNQLQSLNRMESEKHQRSSLEISRLQHEVEQLRTSREKFETHQAAMQQSQEDLHHQIKQLEKHIEKLMSTHQEEEYSYKQRINEMSNKIQQTENARSSLVQELQNVQSVRNNLEADNTSLRQRLEESKHQLIGSEQDLMKLQNRLEEANLQQRELANCLDKMRSEVMDLTNVKHEHLQLIQSLKQENECLTSEISQAAERMTADSSDQQQKNGEMIEKSTLIDVNEHEAILMEKEAVTQKFVNELEQSKKEIMSMSKDLEYYKLRNKEINEEKDKATEALSIVEKTLQDTLITAEKQAQEAQLKADSSSKEMQNILNKRIKEVEVSLQENYSKEILNVKQQNENIKKEADEKILKAETQANLRLEEFQESLYERLNQINFESEEKVKEAIEEKELVKDEFENFADFIKEFLCRIFPKISVPKSIENKQSLSDYESQVKSHLENLQKDMTHDSKDLENMLQKLSEKDSEKLNLECQIKHYASVLTETENILKSLQNNIEYQEKTWNKELQNKDDSIKEMKNENEELKSQNNTLQSKMEQLQDLKESLVEIEELKLKLQKEEIEKKLLQEKLGGYDLLSNSSSMHVMDHALTQISEANSNIFPSKSEKKKKSRKRGTAGKK